MKLNLLPKTVDTTSKAKRAFFGSLLLFIASLVGAFLMAKVSGDWVAESREKLDSAKSPYDAVVKIATDADAMMTSSKVKQIVTNADLAKKMIAANDLYPDLFNSVRPYIPGFFRIMDESATPIDDKNCTIQLVGTIKNAREYADLQMALLRIPGSTNVTRAGFEAEDIIVPPLTEADQVGRRRKESEGPVPDDAFERLAYFENQQVPSGFLNSGEFGNTEFGVTKTVRPGESLITVSITVPKDIRVPDPRTTISTLTAGAAGAATAVGAPGTAAAGTPPVANGAD